MDVPQSAVIAVVDGEIFNLYKNAGHTGEIKLVALDTPETEDRHAANGRGDSAGNPGGNQHAEDAFGKGVVEKLNAMVLKGRIEHLIIIAAPRSLGEMRRNYHSKLKQVLLGEIDKVMTGATVQEIQHALAAA